jgi:pilus assembly protein Flp/PilA
MTLIKKLQNDDGATAIEYGLLAALIAVAIVLVVAAVGQTLGGTFKNVNDELVAAEAQQVQP